MRILVLADLDDSRWQRGTGTADVVIGLGDLYAEVLLEAAAAYQCSTIFAVHGNHDVPAEFPAPIRNLHLQTATVNGLKLGGFEGCWQYKPDGNFMYTQEQANKLLRKLPAVDLLITHNSPRGTHECDSRVHQGFEGLRDYVTRSAPQLVIHGHQHVNQETRIGQTLVRGIYGTALLDWPPAPLPPAGTVA